MQDEATKREFDRMQYELFLQAKANTVEPIIEEEDTNINCDFDRDNFLTMLINEENEERIELTQTILDAVIDYILNESEYRIQLVL